MTAEEAIEYLIGLSYIIGTVGMDSLSDADAEKMREAIRVLDIAIGGYPIA